MSISRSEYIQIAIGIGALLTAIAASVATYQANSISRTQLAKQEIDNSASQAMESHREAIRMLYEAEVFIQSSKEEKSPYAMRLYMLGAYHANAVAADTMTVDPEKREHLCKSFKGILNYYLKLVEANWPKMIETDYPSLAEYRERNTCS